MIVTLCALPSEAAPLLEQWDLSRHRIEAPFTCYADDTRLLAVTGIGASKALFALGWLAHRLTGQPLAVLNVGIAGHRSRPIGDAVLAHSVGWEATNERWYPAICFNHELPTSAVLSVATPSEDYPADTCLDMEAGPLFSAAFRLTSAELVHSLKIVSDNQQRGIEQIDREFVQSLIKDKINTIETVEAALRAQINDLDTAYAVSTQELFSKFFATKRMSVSDTRAIKDLVRRLLSISNPITVENALQACQQKTSAEIRHELTWQIRKTPFPLPGSPL